MRIVLLLGLLALPLAAQAQPYEVAWATVDGGGVASAAGGAFEGAGTTGQPDAGGPYAAAGYTVHSGFWALLAGGGAVPQADLRIAKTDGATTAVPGQTVVYTIDVTNDGPAAVTGALVGDAPPAILTGISWTCQAPAGSSCPASGSGPIAHPVSLLVGATARFTLTATLAGSATGTLVNTATVSSPAGVSDPNAANNAATDTDVILAGPPPAEGELVHGTRLSADLAGSAGAADVDLFRLRQQPYSAYEIVVDEASGDVSGPEGPFLERVAADGTTVLQTSVRVGTGTARSLRFMNTTGTSVDGDRIRVRSAGCGSQCGPDDVYRLRAYETTGSIPRFNNSGSQVSVVVLANAAPVAVRGRLLFWSASGVLLHEQALDLASNASVVVNTAGIGALAGQGGSVTVVHDGPYGAVTGKSVALEPATGFAFDSFLIVRPR